MSDDEDDYNNVEDDDDESITDYSSSSEESISEAEIENVHGRLLSAIDRFSAAGSRKNNVSTTQHASEDAFSSALFQSSSSAAQVSMSDLLGALEKSTSAAGTSLKGLSAVKKRLSEFEKGLSAPAYVEKVTAQRVERSVVYGESAQDMGKWHATVSANRHTRTLDLAQDNRYANLPSHKALVSKFRPATDMEREVQMVLLGTGGTDKQAMRNEEEALAESDALGRRGLSVEELRERQAELAKVKARMFYEQMKSHRLNKIKSKAYHRIKKRQRERREKFGEAGSNPLGADNDDDNDNDDNGTNVEREEAAAAARIKERMTLRHRNTTKWARMALEHGRKGKGKGSGGAELKQAYQEAVQLGRELLEKVNDNGTGSDSGSDSDSESDSDGSSENDNDSDENNTTSKNNLKKSKKTSSAAAKGALSLKQQWSAPSGASTSEQDGGRYKRLLDMDFMRKANEARQARSHEEAQAVLLELRALEEEAEDHDGDGDDTENDSDGGGKRQNGVKMTTSAGGERGGFEHANTNTEERKRLLAAARSQMDQLFAANNNNNSSANNTGALLVQQKGRVKQSAVINIVSSDVGFTNNLNKGSNVDKSATNDISDSEEDEVDEGVKEADSNPWLQPVRAESGTNRNKGKGNTKEKEKEKDKANTNGKAKSQPSQQCADASDGGNLIKTRVEGTTTKNSNNKCIGNGNGGNSEPPVSTTAVATAVATDKEKAKKPQQPERKPLLMQKSQADLVQLAFAGPDLEAEFADLKHKAIGEELGFDRKRKDVLAQVKAGWGDWAGPGQGQMVVSAKTQRLRDSRLKNIDEAEQLAKQRRKDSATPNVVLNERRIKGAAKFVVDVVPHPFTSREEYERSLQMPLGAEWNASHVVHSNTKPDILTRAGRIIEPIKLTAEAKNKNNDNKRRADHLTHSHAKKGASNNGKQQQQDNKKAKRIS